MYYTFRRENNNFDDILSDAGIKNCFDEKIRWANHLMVGLSRYHKDFEKNQIYLTLKYGDDLVNDLTKNYAPIPDVDYTPERKKK